MLSRCWLLLSQWHITTPHAWHSNLQQCCCDENLESCMFCVLFLWISPLVSYPLLVAAPVITSLFPVLPTVLKLKDILLEWSRVIGLYSWLHIGKLSCTISTSSLFPDFYVLLTIHLSIFISVINQLDAQNFSFTISLFHASTCFEHMCSSSGGQNCITQRLVSSHWNKWVV